MGRKKKELEQLQKIPLRQISLEGGSSGKKFSDDKIEELAQSMVSKGLLEPVLVMETSQSGQFRLITGEGRYLAAKKLGWRSIECLVLQKSFLEEIKVIERLRSGEFDPWELSDTLLTLKEKLGWTQSHLGIALGKNRDFVANILAITQITPEVRRYILSRKKGPELTTRHLRYVARAGKKDQLRIAQRISADKLSTTELEREKRGAAIKSAEVTLIKIREIKKPGTYRYPKNTKEWKKYHRQLNTDLRRIDRQETKETRRSKEVISESKLRIRNLRKEANRKRRQLKREIRLALKYLTGMDGY